MKVENVKARGRLFRDVKEWRQRFRETNDAQLELAQRMMSPSIRAEFEEKTSEFHIFEHERTQYVGKKLEQLQQSGVELESRASMSADVEYQYELEAEPVERAAMAEGNTIMAELDGWSNADKTMSPGTYEALSLRIDRWATSVEHLLDLETGAKARFTGSGPGSVPGPQDKP